MRIVLTATMAASVLAIGLSSAQSLAPAGNPAGPDGALRLVQQKEMGPGPAGPGPSMGPGGPGMRSPSQGGPSMGSPPSGGGKMRGEGGPQFRSGERGMGYGPRTGERSRVWVGRERDRGHMRDHTRRHYGGRGFEAGPRFGYVGDCAWLRHRALDTGSRYWWRQYRACMH
jgi:hypothetical protein